MTSNSNRLHNNHNVYILGAGFSRLAGLPLIADFMMQMRDALEYHSNQGHQQECQAIEAVLDFRLKASSAAYRVQIDLENIEELFSLASASPSTMEDSIKLAIAATLDFAQATSKKRNAEFRASRSSIAHKENWNWRETTHYMDSGTWKAPAYEYIVRALLGDWRDSLSHTENSFITFNYDTLLEDALDALNIDYYLGFGQRKKEDYPKTVNLLKLHGSVNWTIPKGYRTKIEVLESYRHVVNSGHVPEIIPPTWKKDSRGAFNDIWNTSLSALSDATRVVVIGFSMPPSDLHFKYLLAAGLKENYSLREIVFVNPENGISLVKERCANLFANQEHNAAKLRFVPSTADAFTGQGTDAQHVHSISRQIPEDIQGLQF